MNTSSRLFSWPGHIGLLTLNIVFVFVMLSEPLGDAAEGLMIKMAAPFQSRHLYDNVESVFAYKFQERDRPHWRQDKILLLTLDDLEVQTEKQPYPFSYAKYADDIRMLYQLEAKAIFIDLLITDERGIDSGIEYLVNTLCEINPSTPVFLASTRLSGQNFNPTPLHPALAAHSNYQNEKPVCFHEVSVAVADISGEHKFWYYPLRELKTDDKTGATHTVPSAALGIYNYFAKQAGEAIIDPATISDSENLMALTWGATPSQFNLNFEAERRKNQDKKFCRESKDPAEYLSFLPGVSYFFEDKDLPLCPYFSETRPGFLAALDASDEIGKSVAQNLVKDNLVIYSVNMTGVADVVTSPVHGAVSGAHYHAMAFHNLERFGKNYIRGVQLEFSSLNVFFPDSPSERSATLLLMASIVLLTAASQLKHWVTQPDGPFAKYIENTLYTRTPVALTNWIQRFRLRKKIRTNTRFIQKLWMFLVFVIWRGLTFVFKTAFYIALACCVVLGLSQFVILDPFIWIEAATLVTLLFASNAIGQLFEHFIEQTETPKTTMKRRGKIDLGDDNGNMQ